jgi:hypothetical protein
LPPHPQVSINWIIDKNSLFSAKHVEIKEFIEVETGQFRGGVKRDVVAL